MPKAYEKSDRIYEEKKLMRIREDDYARFHQYCIQQIVNLSVELDDLEKHLVKVDAAILRVLAATSSEEVDSILEQFTEDAEQVA
jgi:hypothetical protein